MERWHVSFLGIEEIPRSLSEFEMAYFFSVDVKPGHAFGAPVIATSSCTDDFYFFTQRIGCEQF